MLLNSECTCMALNSLKSYIHVDSTFKLLYKVASTPSLWNERGENLARVLKALFRLVLARIVQRL